LARIAPGQRLPQGPVIVAGSQALDIETAVIALDRAFGPEYDAGSHSPLAHRVTDVEAFDACRRRVELNRLGQRLQLRSARRLGGAPHVEPELRVGAGHFEPPRTHAAHAGANPHGPLHALRKGRLEQIRVFDRLIDEDFAGRVATQVVLPKEAGQQLAGLGDSRTRKEVAAAQIAPTAHVYDGHAVVAPL